MSVVDERADAPMLVRALEKGKFVRVNDSFKAKVGFDAAELAEKPFLDWIDPHDRAMVQAALENDESSFFARHITRDGNTLQLRIQLAEHEDSLFVLGRCAKLPTQLESDAARFAEATISGTLDAIARIIEEQNPGYKCSILLVADGRFVFGAGPSLPEDYNAAVNGYAVGPTVGSCGTAIFWNTPVIVEDIQADPLWSALAKLAKKAGVAACWSHPFVCSSGNVLGALALYSPEPRVPTAEQLSLLKAFARITGLAVERGRAEEELKRTDEAIKAVRNELQATLDALPDLLFEVDSEGRIFRYHTHRNDLLAAPPEAFMGKRFADVLPPDVAAACQRAIDEASQEGLSYGQTSRIALPQGEHWFELSVARKAILEGQEARFIVIARDITERKQTENQLRETRDMMQAAVSAGQVYPWVWDLTNDRLHWGVPPVPLLGQMPVGRENYPDFRELVHPEDRDTFLAAGRHSLDTGSPYYHEFRIVMTDGVVRWVAARGEQIRDDAGKVAQMLGSTMDITRRRQAEERINELAFFDQLTGLPNRTLLLDRLKQAMTAGSRNGSHGALLFIDLDNFKMLNDSLGHDMGDLLLKQVAQRLTACVRAGDTVARFGGDEFVVMLASLSMSAKEATTQTEAVGEKILAALNQTYRLKEVAYHSTPSIGATLFAGQQTGIDVLLKQADLAMYQSKKAGRNALRFFDPGMASW